MIIRERVGESAGGVKLPRKGLARGEVQLLLKKSGELLGKSAELPDCLCIAFHGRLTLIHLRCWEVLPFLTIQRQRCIIGGKKVYTKGVFSSENSSASTGKREVWCIPKSLFSREKGRKMHIRQSAFKVFVGDPFAQYWCIDLGLLYKIQGP